jgi:hypothetical protein
MMKAAGFVFQHVSDAWTISIPLAIGGSALAPEMVGTLLGRQLMRVRIFRIVSFPSDDSMAIFFVGRAALGKRYQYLIATASGALFGLTVISRWFHISVSSLLACPMYAASL